MLARRQVALALIISGLLITVVLLASSLSSVQLRAGTFAPTASFGAAGGAPVVQVGDGRFDFIIVLFLVIVVCVGLYFLVQDRNERRVLFRRVALMLVLSVVLFVIQQVIRTPEAEEPTEIEPIAAPTTFAPAIEAPELLPPPVAAPTEGMALVISAAILIGLVAIGWIIWQRRSRPVTITIDAPLDRLGQEARAAADALEQGEEIKDVVMRCYLRMGEVLDEARGLRRKTTMTPREFEEMLVAAGLPAKPVQRLTRLFELVRYGTDAVGMRQQQEAISSLIAIAEACEYPL